MHRFKPGGLTGNPGAQHRASSAVLPDPGPSRLPPTTSPSDMSPRRTDAKMTRAGHRHHYDAIVVGARVAGAATAMLLSAYPEVLCVTGGEAAG